MDKVKRNDPCPCGSGKKSKHCCLGQDTAGGPTVALGPDRDIASLVADGLAYVDEGRDKIACGVLTQLDNASVYEPEFGATGVEFCAYFLKQFTDEDPHHLENVRGALGQFHFRAGDPGRGEEALRALIADRPHRAIGYAFLSDALGFHRYAWNGSRSLDPARAVAVLEEALAAGVEDAGDYDLQARLDDMRREAGRA